MKFDDRVTWAVLAALALEAVGGLLWAGGAAARLTQAEAQMERLAAVNERLARLEAEMSEARASLARIENRLERRSL